MEKTKEKSEIDFQSYWQNASEGFVTTLFNQAGVPPPPLSEQFKIAKKADEWIALRLKTAFPGAIRTVLHLKERGYLLYTASGGTTWQLKGYLTGMGILDCFEELYGADLINTMKASLLFYSRMFQHAGINPEHALVVDDYQDNVVWAQEVGATGVLVSGSNDVNQTKPFYSISRLDQLPHLLCQIVDSTK